MHVNIHAFYNVQRLALGTDLKAHERADMEAFISLINTKIIPAMVSCIILKFTQCSCKCFLYFIFEGISNLAQYKEC